MSNSPQDAESIRLGQICRREAAIEILSATAKDTNAFPSDRTRAEKILSEAGVSLTFEQPVAEETECSKETNEIPLIKGEMGRGPRFWGIFLGTHFERKERYSDSPEITRLFSNE